MKEKKPTPDEGLKIEEQLLDTEDAAEQPAEASGAGEAPGEDETSGASEDEWRAALETAVKQRDEYLNLAQRVQADFQNFRRRNEKARTDGYDDGMADTMTALLPVLDNFERAVQAADEQGDQSPLAEGVRMIHRQLVEALNKLNLGEVDALGQKFDPELHNAVMRAEEGEPGIVLEVFQKGYRFKERMLRYAMVKVSAD